MADIIPVYKGEARLLRWSETFTGRTVTLQLDEDVGTSHPFKGVRGGETHGARMQIVCVLIGDDEEPLAPPQVSTEVKAEAPAAKSKEEGEKERTPFRQMKRSAQAALKCQDPEFQAWLKSRVPGGDACIALAEDAEGAADRRLKDELGIISKRELDIDATMGAAFDKLLASFDYRHRV